MDFFLCFEAIPAMSVIIIISIYQIVNQLSSVPDYLWGIIIGMASYSILVGISSYIREKGGKNEPE